MQPISFITHYISKDIYLLFACIVFAICYPRFVFNDSLQRMERMDLIHLGRMLAERGIKID